MICGRLLPQIRRSTTISKRLCNTQKIQWEGVVGLEIHAQLLCKSKLFSGAGTQFASPVNGQVSLFDAAIPGTLPILNRECVEKGILTALALNCDIHPVSQFDRKHYFYADLPAGYQITQQRHPIASNGWLEFSCYQKTKCDTPYLKKTKITQIQLEQDSGKSLHDTYTNQSLVDLNRAGNPLIELVFAPDLKNGDEASCLVNELMMILKALNTCSCKIEEGALRVDANVSVRPKGSTTLGIRTEIKNIGGLSNVQKAIDFEILRQTRMSTYGKQIMNETRSWDADRNITMSMRDKEVEQDYRFMPEPNLLPLRVIFDENDTNSDVINVGRIRKLIPELPADYRSKLCNKYNLSNTAVLRLLMEPELLKYFLYVVEDNQERNSIKVCNILIYDFLAVIHRIPMDIETCKMKPEHFSELYDLFITEQLINRIVFQRILELLIKGTENNPRQIVDSENWYQINDTAILEESCKLTIEFNDELVRKFHSAKTKKKPAIFQKLYNEALQCTEGRANLIELKEILSKLLTLSSPDQNEKQKE